MEKLTQVLLELARLRVKELTIEETHSILQKERIIKDEAYQIVTYQIPDFLEYLEVAIPAQKLIGFKQFTRGLYE